MMAFLHTHQSTTAAKVEELTVQEQVGTDEHHSLVPEKAIKPSDIQNEDDSNVLFEQPNLEHGTKQAMKKRVKVDDSLDFCLRFLHTVPATLSKLLTNGEFAAFESLVHKSFDQDCQFTVPSGLTLTGIENVINFHKLIDKSVPDVLNVCTRTNNTSDELMYKVSFSGTQIGHAPSDQLQGWCSMVEFTRSSTKESIETLLRQGKRITVVGKGKLIFTVNRETSKFAKLEYQCEIIEARDWDQAPKSNSDIRSVPLLLCNAQNASNFPEIERIMHAYFDEDCLCTTASNAELKGQREILQYYSELENLFPDHVTTVRDTTVVDNVILCNTLWSGTKPLHAVLGDKRISWHMFETERGFNSKMASFSGKSFWVTGAGLIMLHINPSTKKIHKFTMLFKTLQVR